ncbi:DUF2244 domain-containing protein [Massilia sp. H6]|uniref:DUF2244 domain-containing protein n=1 Tax=Massilia sp. H6 TaxID=2970464 RepID=UPI002169758D|nr:DUF2244 domain-containing protein [Massilia sp. H6]UVW27029.1 DUF2244 domain-containing protein [Massilia sp. H6]
MKRNCSMTPRQALLVYALLCCATLGIALAMTLRGAWMVLAFALLESAGLGAALLHYCRHALDHERIRLEPGSLLIEHADGARCAAVRLDPARVRISLADDRMRTLVVIESGRQRVEVGRYLTASARLELVRALRTALRAGAVPGTSPTLSL